MMVRGRVLVLRMHLIEPPCAKAAFCRRSSICFCGWAGVAGGRLVFDHDQSRLNCQGTSATFFVRVLRFRFPSTDTMRMSSRFRGPRPIQPIRPMLGGYRNTQWRKIDLERLDMFTAHSWPLEDGTMGIQAPSSWLAALFSVIRMLVARSKREQSALSKWWAAQSD